MRASRIISWYAVVLLGLTGHSAAGQLRQAEGLSIESRVLGTPVRFSVVLPDGYHDTDERYPVIYMLHGLGGSESSWIEYSDIAATMDRLVTEGRTAPFIAVMPDGGSEYYSDFADGSYPYMMMLTTELLPHIDLTYRTIADRSHRAVTGYSMGGFVALALAMKNPDLFSVCVPLSASIRTDGQYTEESSPGWDHQWGRIFGGQGMTGPARITDHYRQNSPIHLAATMDSAELARIGLYIINGDREHTLCRSNEELHRILTSRGIPHLYRVDSGGHDFVFWNGLLPEVLDFTGHCFTGDSFSPVYTRSGISAGDNILSAPAGDATLYFPEDTTANRRRYPVVYAVGFDEARFGELLGMYRCGVREGRYIPVVLCRTDGYDLRAAIGHAEQNPFVRTGQRFRAVWSTGDAGRSIEEIFCNGLFSVAVLSDAATGNNEREPERIVRKAAAADRPAWAYIHTASFSENYHGSSLLHIHMTEHGMRHEFRARQTDGDTLAIDFDEAMRYIAYRLHY